MKSRTSIVALSLMAGVATAPLTAAFAQAIEPGPLPDIESIQVRGVYIPQEKRETSEVSAVIDSEDFERQGDDEIAAALRRVTGLSLVRGKFVYVRGLGERYSQALLNGSPLPSPEPLRRVVPLDLFPTSAIESTLVQKTFSPDMPAEFGGGTISLRLKGIPDERFLEAKASVGGNTESTLQNRLTYDGGDADWLGYDDGTRNFPPLVADGLAQGLRINNANFTDEELQAIGRSFNNAQTSVVQRGLQPVNGSINLIGGDRVYRDNWGAGFIASVGFRNNVTTKRGVQESAFVSGDSIAAAEGFDFESNEYEATTHALVSAGVDLGQNHEISASTFYVHKGTKEARIRIGFNENNGTSRDDPAVRIENTEFYERQLWKNDIYGEHSIPFGYNDIQLNWRIAYGQSFRDAPYFRENIRTDADRDGRFEFNFNQEIGPSIEFSKIEDDVFSYGADIVVPLEAGENILVDVKGGFAYADLNRDAAQVNFRFRSVGALPAELLLQRIDFFLAEQNINPNRLELQEIGTGFDSDYQGKLQTNAAYGGIDAQIGDFWRLAAGLRYEDGDQSIDAFERDGSNLGFDSLIREDYLLPAVSLTWNPLEDVQLRGAFSQTITRPQFRELAESRFVAPEFDLNLIGNSALVNTEIDNYDARFEYYIGRDQFLTLGFFYKDLEKPIENFIIPATNQNGDLSFVNAPSATLWGIEFEFEKYLGGLGFLGGESREFLIKTNYTYSDSSVNVGANDTVDLGGLGGEVSAVGIIEDGRPLQGQSDHLFNLQFGYDDFDKRASATLLVNFASKRLRQVALGAIPNVIERPPVTVDFTYSREVDLWGGAYEFGFEAGNLLNDRYEATQSLGPVSLDRDTYDLGRSFSISLKRRF